MKILFWIFVIILVIVGIVFASLNAESVMIHYFFGAYHLPLSILLAITLAVGCALGWLVNLPSYFRHKKQIRQLQKKLTNAERELENLRTIPYRETM